MIEAILGAIGDILVQMVNKAPIVESKDDEIIFKFGKLIRITMLICSIISGIGLIVSFVWAVIDFESVVLFLIIIFLGWLVLCVYAYLVTKNKKIILKNNIFYVTDFLGKISEYRIEEVVKVKLICGDGIVLYTWSNQKFKVDEQMSNYGLLMKKILEKEIKIVNLFGKTIN